MPYGPAANCINCKFLTSQILVNSKQDRICADCLQKDYITVNENLNRAFGELYSATKANDELAAKLKAYEALLDQIKNFCVKE
jgi:uncharacterized protein YecT (DUF1311 family)